MLEIPETEVVSGKFLARFVCGLCGGQMGREKEARELRKRIVRIPRRNVWKRPRTGRGVFSSAVGAVHTPFPKIATFYSS